MTYTSTENWWLILHVMAVCLWGMTIAWMFTRKLRRTRHSEHNLTSHHLSSFREAVRHITRQYEAKLEVLSETVRLERELLEDLLEKQGRIGRGNQDDPVQWVALQERLTRIEEADPDQGRFPPGLHKKILKAVAAGKDLEDTARDLGMPRAEVELIVNLSKETHQRLLGKTSEFVPMS